MSTPDSTLAGLGAGRSIGPMRAHEVATLVQWAADEQWNPGRSDVSVAWAVDPVAFIAVREGDDLVAAGTVFSYDGAFGFMGLFIVRHDLRGAGLGSALWHYRRDLLLSRLRPGASIGMDGVFDMVPFYERGGFALAYRDLRFTGTASGTRDPEAVDLASVPFALLDTYDRQHVPAPRTAFLERWIAQPGVRGAALFEDGSLVAYGVLRPCSVGFRFGPVFADRPELAERIVDHLLAGISGEQVQLDVPEPNGAALLLAAERGLAESFGCARMYLGPNPMLPVERIFGVTSFEFG